MIGKCQDENQTFPEHTHIYIFYRGGWWKVNKIVVTIFSFAEVFLLSSTANQSNNIDIKLIVSPLRKDSYALIHFSRNTR